MKKKYAPRELFQDVAPDILPKVSQEILERYANHEGIYDIGMETWMFHDDVVEIIKRGMVAAGIARRDCHRLYTAYETRAVIAKHLEYRKIVAQSKGQTLDTEDPIL